MQGALRMNEGALQGALIIDGLDMRCIFEGALQGASRNDALLYQWVAIPLRDVYRCIEESMTDAIS